MASFSIFYISWTSTVCSTSRTSEAGEVDEKVMAEIGVCVPVLSALINLVISDTYGQFVKQVSARACVCVCVYVFFSGVCVRIST